MPNQPAKDSAAIYLRVPQKVKDNIQTEVDRINTKTSGANATISSWIRAAIEAQLKSKVKPGK